MKVAIDFGITVTDILKKESNGDLIHNSMLSKKKPSEELINESKLSPYTGYRSLDERWMGERLRDIHDLFHVITGYGRDALGELCLLAFTNAQHYRSKAH